MKKGIINFFVVLFIVFSMIGLADAATHHSGSITSDETWTLAGSPHIIDSLMGVNNGATLTIEPGVEVRFNENATNPRLSIGDNSTTGKLVAQGTESQKITFTSNATSPQPGDWRSINFNSDASDESIIEHAILEYGGNGGIIDISSSNPKINNCTIRNGSDEGIYIYHSTSEISGCRFEGNGGYGIEIVQASPVLDANEFINNGSYPVAVTIGAGGWPEPVIYGTNTFSGNTPDQIYFNVYHISYNLTLRYLGIPYFFTGLTVVNNGATLTIEPGVEVRFNQDATNPSLIIGEAGEDGTVGKLIAQGTESQKITFTSNAASPQPGDWAHILFWQSASDDSIIEHAILEYGGSHGMIDIDSSNPTIRNCIIRYGSLGIYSYHSTSEISGCRFEENEGYGINIIQSSPVLDANEFINNGSYPVAVTIGTGGWPEPVIYGTNTFSGNTPDQIYFNVYHISYNLTLRYLGIPYFFTGLTVVNNGATLTIEPGVEVRLNKEALNPRLCIGDSGTTGKLIAQGTASQKIRFTSSADTPQPGDWSDIYFWANASDDSIIEDAILEYGGISGIIQMHSSNPTIRNCTIRNGSGEGIYIYDSTSEVSCCDITNNDIGIHVVGNILNNPTINNNNIFGNTTYGIQNTSPSNIVNAEDNWWGHASGPGGVGPGTGDPVSSGVDYDPWLTMISSCSFFADVPPGYWAEAAIYKIYNAGITKGCSQNPLMYCPEGTVTRAQMAVFLGRGIHGSGFNPPTATGIFSDVPTNYWAADWIEQFSSDGITSGCGTNPLRYCPENNVTRAQMAIFLLRSKHGSSYTPPTASGIFSDVPVTYWAAAWIEQLYNEGITTGCATGPLRYCPENSVTRAQMAVFIMRTFGL